MPAAFLPQAIETASVENQADVIEVIGTRAQEAEKIDRRTYQVQQTPHSAQKDAVQLLRGLPAITVTPDDRILLLGAGNANIYINGRPYIGDAKQYLRTLHGTDIDRIEVLTNPSAQFSAEGTGGVINVVLRKNETAGTSGNVSLQSSSYGHSLVDTTVNVKRGKWAYEVKAGGNVGTMVRSRYQKLRTVEASGGGLATANSEDGEFSYEGVVGRLSGKVTYDLDPKTTISAQLGGGGGHDIVTNKGQFLGLTADFPSFYEHRILSSVASYLTGDFSILHRGTAKGETLSASAQFYANPDVRDVTNARFSDGRLFRTDVRKPSHSVDAHIDWKRPTAAGQILSIGSTWRLDGTTQDYRFTNIGAGSTLGPDVADAYDGSSSTIAAYATFQQPLGDLILTPGLRVEHNARRISSPGSADLVIRRSDLFPTFHAKQRLGRKLDLSASYSKRIERARLEILRPYGLVEDAVTSGGNDLLQLRQCGQPPKCRRAIRSQHPAQPPPEGQREPQSVQSTQSGRCFRASRGSKRLPLHDERHARMDASRARVCAWRRGAASVVVQQSFSRLPAYRPGLVGREPSLYPQLQPDAVAIGDLPVPSAYTPAPDCTFCPRGDFSAANARNPAQATQNVWWPLSHRADRTELVH
ncbi:MAG: TonB-dependent receptor [Rhizobiaceae bacterium]|nr:MAG: TonB-dependent receptor [Rhizobiaceae bacterium]